MAIVQLTRFRSEKTEDMIEAAKMAKKIFEGHGAEYLRLSRFCGGAFAGEWRAPRATPIGKCTARRKKK